MALTGPRVVRRLTSFARGKPEGVGPLRVAPVIKESVDVLRAMANGVSITADVQSQNAMVLANPWSIRQIVTDISTARSTGCGNEWQTAAKAGGMHARAGTATDGPLGWSGKVRQVDRLRHRAGHSKIHPRTHLRPVFHRLRRRQKARDGSRTRICCGAVLERRFNGRERREPGDTVRSLPAGGGEGRGAEC